MTAEKVLRLESLVVEYERQRLLSFGKRSVVRAVNDVSFSLDRGEILGILGESGSGKSTLLKAINRFIPIRSGRIFIDEVDITALSRKEYFPYRKKIQLIPQNFCEIFNPKMTVGEILAEPLEVHFPQLTAQEQALRIENLLQSVELDLSLLERFPMQLSGGQRQRLSIARALAVEPEILICDEIVSACDLYTQKQILSLLSELNRKRNVAILFISHNIAVLSHFCHRIVVIHKGRVIEIDTPEMICKFPNNPYVKQLIDAVPHIKLPQVK
jgi:ABC-type glutathione transport system ATPase component